MFSQPDKPKGRGYKLTPPPVKVLAQEHGIPVYQPASVRTPEVLELLESLAPDALVVVAYGKILPKSILELPPKGCINVHGSLLPKYRGAAPIQWTVLNGDPVGGVTTMYMDVGMDTGDILLTRTTPVGEQETAGELFDRLADLGAQLLLETLDQVQAGTIQPRPQEEALATHAPMLTKEMARMDFTQSAQALHNLVRGMNPWPVARTTLHGKLLKVLATSPLADWKKGEPGQVLESGERLVVACGQGALALERVQLEGSKPMASRDFLRGHPVEKGTFLGQ